VSERWDRVTELFAVVRSLDPARRGAFLDLTCGDDVDLRDEIVALLAGDVDDRFLEPPGRGAARDARDPLEIGALLNGRYLVEGRLASGGHALIYRATDRLLSRPVAIKIARGHPDSARLKQRFQREMQALARIDDPAIVGILDVGELNDGSPFLVIQHVSGITLRELLSGASVDAPRAAAIVRAIGAALGVAHAADVAHRDLKPENVMLQQREDGREQVKLIDFGIAKIEGSDLPDFTTVTIEGSVRYMAPEQFEGKNTSASDVYALALVACELIGGKPDPRTLPAATSRKVRQLLTAALAFDPEERPQNIRVWAEQLAAAIESRARAPLLLGALAAVAVVASLVFVLGGRGGVAAERIIEKSGGFDPVSEGFQTFNQLTGAILQNANRTGFDAWTVQSSYHGGGFYIRGLTTQQQTHARTRGWTLTGIVRATTGAAAVDVQFDDVRFDINVLVDGDAEVVRLNTQIVPEWQGLELRLPRSAPTEYRRYELRFDPSLQTTDLWIDGERRLAGYRGHHQFIDKLGVMFGVAPYKSDHGAASFRLVRFEIHP
jgi:hypothetical protein